MTGAWNSRTTQVALAVIALGAFALRVFPFFGPDGAWTLRVDYDEGVYFSAASWLLKGALPYRDFVFVHPPGVVLFLAVSSAWTQAFLGVDGAFALSRWLAAALGAVNVLLVGRLVLRWAPARPGAARWGALFAATIYATYPELVQVERGPFLEPVLNCVCLLMASAVVAASTCTGGPRGRWLLAAGGLAGLAVSIKVWAAIWVVGALWAIASFATRREGLRFVLSALGIAGLLVLPFALRAPSSFVTQVGLLHLWRPPDGMTERWPRLEQIVALRHLASPLLALGAVVLLALRKGPAWGVCARLFGAAWVLTVAAFFAAAAYWNQYNAHLVASEAVLAGAALTWLSGQRRAVFLPLLLAGGVSLAISVGHVLRRSSSDGAHLALARSPLAHTAACVFTFEPGWSLAAGRLPPALDGRPVVDSYAHLLLDAVSGGRRFSSANEAFAANHGALPGVARCRFLVLGERGRRQLSGPAQESLRGVREIRDLGGLEAWELRGP